MHTMYIQSYSDLKHIPGRVAPAAGAMYTARYTTSTEPNIHTRIIEYTYNTGLRLYPAPGKFSTFYKLRSGLTLH